MPAAARELYREAVLHPQTRRFGEVASIGIGYVTGANDFFHLRPSEAALWDIPEAFLHPTVRNGRALPPRRLTVTTVEMWCRNDDPVLLLRLPKRDGCAYIGAQVPGYRSWSARARGLQMPHARAVVCRARCAGA